MKKKNRRAARRKKTSKNNRYVRVSLKPLSQYPEIESFIRNLSPSVRGKLFLSVMLLAGYATTHDIATLPSQNNIIIKKTEEVTKNKNGKNSLADKLKEI